MSRERARRRAERQAVAAVERARRDRQVRRRAGWASLRGVFGPRRSASARRPSSALGRQRSRQNGVLAAVVVALHTVLWLLAPSWWVRGSAAVLTLIAWPLLLVLLFDRRTSG